MADTITYFGDPVRATDRNGKPIMVNGRPLLIPENFDLQNEINAAHYAATRPDGPEDWLKAHYSHGSAGDPQRQAGYSGGFDPRYQDGGNYGFGLGAAAAGYSVEAAIEKANLFNKRFGTGKPLPKTNESAIRQAYQDYQNGLFLKPDAAKGEIYVGATEARDYKNFYRTIAGSLLDGGEKFFAPKRTDVERYALQKWGNLDSPEAKAFMANFEQAFGGYPQHLDLDKLHPLPADGGIPPGKDVSLFVGRNGEVLYYGREPAPGGSGGLRGVYGLDGAPNGGGSTGMTLFDYGTPRPVSVYPHLASPRDPTGGIDVTLKDGSKEHWWNDQIKGFIRSRISPFDGGAAAVPFAPPAGVVPNSYQPDSSPRSDAAGIDPRNIRVLSRINPPGAIPSLPENTRASQQASKPPGLASGQPMPDYPAPPWLFGLPDRSAASGDDMDDWYTRWVKPLIQ